MALLNKPLLLAVFAAFFLACNNNCPTNTGYYRLHWEQIGDCPQLRDSTYHVTAGAVMLNPGDKCSIVQGDVSEDHCNGVFDLECEDGYETITVVYARSSHDFAERIRFDGDWLGTRCTGEYVVKATFLHR